MCVMESQIVPMVTMRPTAGTCAPMVTAPSVAFLATQTSPPVAPIISSVRLQVVFLCQKSVIVMLIVMIALMKTRHCVLTDHAPKYILISEKQSIE